MRRHHDPHDDPPPGLYYPDFRAIANHIEYEFAFA